MVRKAIFAIALVLLSTSVAFAAITKDKVGLSARGGVYFLGGEWKANLLGGAEINFGIYNNFSVGLLGTYGRTKGAGLEFRDGKPQLISSDDDLRIRHYILDLVGNFYITPEKRWRPFIQGGIGIAAWRVTDSTGSSVSVPDKNGMPFEFRDQQLAFVIGAGMEYFLIDEFSIGAAVRYHIFTSGFSQFKDDKDIGDDLDNRSGMFEATAMITAYLGACKDDDKDGVCNEDDKCPTTPRGCQVDKSTGCELDADQDKVCDGIDKCPNTPMGCRVDATGCTMDTDGDGVCDGIDRCENTPKDCKVDAYGCPLDSDGDGVWDCRDKCPDTKKGLKVDQSGCPMDEDGDGVYDGADLCPGTPKGLQVDADGCPVAYKIEKELVLVGVTFQVNQAVLTESSKKELDKVVESLKALPHLKLEVAGYTDISGKLEKNMELSQKRAEAVRDYFVSKGVAADRLSAKGYGPDQPKYDNKTAEGRAKNRRVELHRLN